MANNSMTNKDFIIIHQTLHGYKDGHNLLASSIDLNGQERRTLNVLSDYAGTGFEKGFTEYITGYPLASGKYYAFSKTWYADEMPRPGCVWTHTLLIDLSVLWMINNLDMLKALFKRPTENEYQLYTSAFKVDLIDISENSTFKSNLSLKLACQLYNTNKTLGILSESAEYLEAAIFRIWLLQWPRLRRSFSFCTGSISPRKIESKYFDLQVIPKSREWSLAKTDRISMSIVDINSIECDSSWYTLYLHEDEVEVAEYMRKMAADVSPLVSNFKILFFAYLYTKPSTSFRSLDMFKNLITLLNIPEEGKLLKAELLQKAWYSNTNKLDVIEIVANSATFSGITVNFDTLILDAYDKEELSDYEISVAIEIVRNKMDNSKFADMLVRLPLNSWIQSTAVYENILSELIESLGNTAFETTAIWKANDEIQQLWFNSFLHGPSTDWKRLVFTLIRTRTSQFSTAIFNKIENHLFKILFDWMYEYNERLDNEWLFIIKNNLFSSFEEYTLCDRYNKALLQLFPSIISPTDKQWSEISFSSIEQCLDSINSKEYIIEKTALQTFFLTGALMGLFNDALRATTYLFQPLHNTLEKDIFDPITWQRFQAQMAKELYDLVEVDFFSIWFSDRFKIPEWDRCEFLRRSLISGFLKFNWEFEELVEVVTDKPTFVYIVMFCVEVKPLKKKMKLLGKDLARKKANRTFHLAILDKYL